jgi:hypothetical protein
MHSKYLLNYKAEQGREGGGSVERTCPLTIFYVARIPYTCSIFTCSVFGSSEVSRNSSSNAVTAASRSCSNTCRTNPFMF